MKNRRSAVITERTTKLFINGMGKDTTVAKNVIKHSIPRALGEELPPTLVVMHPPVHTPNRGGIVPIKIKYTYIWFVLTSNAFRA